jgi:hypothetical protein
VVRRNCVRQRSQQNIGLPSTGEMRWHPRMVDAVQLFVGAILRLLRTRRRLLLENLALRQQLAVLKRKHAQPRFLALDKLFWVLVRRIWSEWKQTLIIVGPETVVRWHRSRFAMYWRAISRGRRIAQERRRGNPHAGQQPAGDSVCAEAGILEAITAGAFVGFEDGGSRNSRSPIQLASLLNATGHPFFSPQIRPQIQKG